jgi:hypothetical protein
MDSKKDLRSKRKANEANELIKFLRLIEPPISILYGRPYFSLFLRLIEPPISILHGRPYFSLLIA